MPGGGLIQGLAGKANRFFKILLWNILCIIYDCRNVRENISRKVSMG